MERATGEGPKELPTKSKMLESTRALINLQDEYRTRAAHNIAYAQERQTEAQYKDHSQDWRQSLKKKIRSKKYQLGDKLDKHWTGPFMTQITSQKSL